MTLTLDAQTIRQARDDIGVFAEALVGEPLWAHQLEAARSKARIRCICSGRQAGKTRTLAVEALYPSFTTAGHRTLVLSAGEEAAKLLLAEVAGLLSSPLLRGSAVDENRSRITLSNGSEIVSVPASERQIRGRAVDLLILDEACFIAPEIWSAARYTVIARPGSRILMASTPYGSKDGFFAVAYRAGDRGLLKRPLDGYESFRWPSTVSPLVDRELLELWRQTSTEREYQAEVLAEWPDDAGAYFTSEELEQNVADYRMTERGRSQLVVGGVDWGLAHDANALALVGATAGYSYNAERHPDYPIFHVAWLEERFRTPYSPWIDHVVELADWRERAGYLVRILVSECNGVGQMPTSTLDERAMKARTHTWVAAVHTDSRRKANGFGKLKMLLQQGRLVLPRHPGLLRQLSALEFETSAAGNIFIAVPERAGHDDLAMALMQAVTCINTGRLWPSEATNQAGELLTTGSGTRIPEWPRSLGAGALVLFTPPPGVDTSNSFEIGW